MDSRFGVSWAPNFDSCTLELPSLLRAIEVASNSYAGHPLLNVFTELLPGGSAGCCRAKVFSTRTSKSPEVFKTRNRLDPFRIERMISPALWLWFSAKLHWNLGS